MFKIHLCNPQDNWNKLAIIDQSRGHINDFLMNLEKNNWHQLEVVINGDFSRFKVIRDTDDWGIRIETEDLDLGFVLFKKEVVSYNQIKCNLFSASYRLYTSYLDNKDRYYNSSLATLLGNISSDFVFTALGSDVDTIINTGSLDNFEIAKQAIQYKENFEFVDAGLKDTGGGVIKPEIIYGNFGNIETYYNSSSDNRFKPIRFTNLQRVDNSETDIGYLENYTQSQQSEPFTLVYAFAQTGQGSSANSIVELRDPTASYINPQFPLESRTSSVTGRTTYYIRNPYAVNYTERIRVYTPLESVNSIDETGNLDVDIDITPQKLYQKAVAYIQSYSGQQTLTANLAFKKVLLPGNLAKINFKTTYKIDNETITEKITENKILDNLVFDLNSIQN